jgi:hypothetical protein
MAWAFMALALMSNFNAASAQTKPQYTLGMNVLWDNGDPKKLESSFKRMKALGITEARTDWEWRAVEKTPGQYDWSATDRLVNLAYKNGITLYPIVHYAPEWAVVDKKKPDGVYQLAPKPEAYAAYGKFLAASIDRYGPSAKTKAKVAFKPIVYWQVWNEPNIKEFWGPKPNVGEFVKFMQVVNKQIGSRRGSVKIVHAGLSKADFVFLWEAWEKNANYGQLFDVMAVHPYFFDPKGGVRAPDAIDENERKYAELGLVGSPHDAGYLSKVFNIQLFLTLKKSPKPIWITEIGFMAGNGNRWAIDEKRETELTSQTLAFINNRLTKKPFGVGVRKDIAANVQKVFWFCLDDYDFPNDTGNFGVYRTNGAIRPHATAIKQYAPK